MITAGWHKSQYDQSDNSVSERKQYERDGCTTKAARFKSKWVNLNPSV